MAGSNDHDVIEIHHLHQFVGIGGHLSRVYVSCMRRDQGNDSPFDRLLLDIPHAPMNDPSELVRIRGIEHARNDRCPDLLSGKGAPLPGNGKQTHEEETEQPRSHRPLRSFLPIRSTRARPWENNFPDKHPSPAVPGLPLRGVLCPLKQILRGCQAKCDLVKFGLIPACQTKILV